MASLTETAYLTRKAVNIGVIVVAILIVVRITFGLVVGLWKTLFPPPPPAATVAFGKLPYPSAQNSVATPSGNITYTVETAGGSFPTLAKNLKVYFMPRPGPSFGSFEKMKTQAVKMGFTDIPRKVSSTAWRFTDPTAVLRTLDIDEISGNFHLTYNYLSDQSLFSEKNFSTVEALTAKARSFFDGQGLFSVELKAAEASITYFKLDSGALVSTTSLSNADAVGVSFNRVPIEKNPIVSPDPKQGLVSILFSGAADAKKQILEVRFFYTAIDLENFATYPSTSVESAFTMLKSGKAIYASLPDPIPQSISIRKIYLGYLDPYPPQSYLQPVIVFSDEKGFSAYVPAINSEWLHE